jgi:hypothetical protein
MKMWSRTRIDGTPIPPAERRFCQILAQWVWNLRLELGQKLSSSNLRTTEFAKAMEVSPPPPIEPVPVAEPAGVEKQTPQVTYGPAQWARPSFTRGFPGSAFLPQPDGTLLCPAHHSLYPQERRPERDGSYRLLYTACIGDCRLCELRAQCQESTTTRKPRRVSAVFWPAASHEELSPSLRLVSSLSLPQPQNPLLTQPVLMQDWPRCQIRRTWLNVVRSEAVVIAMGVPPPPEPMRAPTEYPITRSERAHWRFSWQMRLIRNARPSTPPPLTLTLHGLPATFASAYGFALLQAA